MSKYFSTQSEYGMFIPLNQFLKDMYNLEDSASSPNRTTSSTSAEVTIDLEKTGEITSSAMSDSKEDVTNCDLDPPKTESFTMDASFLYEGTANQPMMYPVAPPSTQISPFERQYHHNPSSMQFLNYPSNPYSYGYNFLQQPNYMYPHHVQSQIGAHNSLLAISEASAFTPIKPKYFTPRMLSVENQSDANQYKTLQTLHQKPVVPGRKKKPFGNTPPTPETTISVSPSTSQTVQLKEIQEIFANTQIPIVSLFVFNLFF